MRRRDAIIIAMITKGDSEEGARLAEYIEQVEMVLAYMLENFVGTYRWNEAEILKLEQLRLDLRARYEEYMRSILVSA
jgi:hypothetical protein